MTFWVRNILFLTAFVVLVLAEILLSLTNLNALVAQQALTISGYETKDDVQHLRIAADGILTSTRSYVLLGDAGYKQIFAQAKEQISKSLQQLRTLMADEPSQRQRLAQIESLFPSLIGNFEKIMVLYDESGAQAAIARLRLPEDALLAAHLNELILQLDGEQARLLRDRFVADALQERQTWTLIMFCGALSVLVVFGGAFFVYRDLAQRKRTEAELLQKTALLQVTFDNIEQGVAVFDRDLKLTSWSTLRQFDLPNDAWSSWARPMPRCCLRRRGRRLCRGSRDLSSRRCEDCAWRRVSCWPHELTAARSMSRASACRMDRRSPHTPT
jgi:CHASE3 domain sensor protein